ncbi:MAG: ion channel [Nocardioidaceae bacterium]
MRAWTWLRYNPCAALLAAQLFGVLAYPYLDTESTGRQLFALLGLAVLALTIIAVRATPLLNWVAWLIALPAVCLLLAQIVSGETWLAAWASGFEAVLYLYAAVAMLAYMLADERVTTDELFALIAVFTLLAWAFAHVYSVVQAAQPHAFTAATDPENARSWMELLFLSFTTLSSTGLSDVMPISGQARSIVMLEQITGVFYVAMVVTRLVSISARTRFTR